MKITTEGLLTSRSGFGIETATPAQRAACRLIDGRPLGDLATHLDVLALVGGPGALGQLHTQHGSLPLEVVFLAAIRSAKTIIACAAAIRATQTVDVSRLGHGEIPRVSLVSLRLDQSAVAHGLILETMRASSVLRPLLLEETADSLVVRHPSGRPIEIATVAGSKAGGSLVSRWSAGFMADEAPRMSGSDDSVIALDDARSAILGRLLPGAQAIYIGSPWAPHGPIYDLVQEHWQRPSANMLVLRGTGPMLNPTWWTPARCARLEAQDPNAYTCDVLGEFADPESGLLSPFSVRANTRESPLELAPERGKLYAAGIDPSEGIAGGNAWTLVIAERIRDERNEDTPDKFRVACTREWRGLRPEQCWEAAASLCSTYGLKEAWSDQYAASANIDLASRFGLHVRIDKTTATSKLEDFTNLATLIHSDCIELSPDPQLRRDLLSVKKRATQNGMSIILPRTSDGRHADLAPALCSAIKRAAHARDHDMTVYRVSSEQWRRGREGSW